MVDMIGVQERLLQMLEDVGYTGPILEPDKLSQSLKLGAKSPDFTGLVAWFTEQLATFIDIDEIVHATTSADDASSFLLELSFFLKEIGCVNEKLMGGNVNQRLASELERAILIEFLAAELMACKLLEAKYPKEEKQMEVTVNESSIARNLKNILVTLKLKKPPDNISADSIFSRVETRLSEILNMIPSDLLGDPFISEELMQKQVNQIRELLNEMHKEYTLRRDMMLKRLDVTIQSFFWSDRIKGQENEVNKRYEERRKFLKNEPKVTLGDLLAARDDIILQSISEKTSNASVRKNTRSKINSVIIGAVPDRGGRPYEQEPPPPEMPPWQKDRVQGPSSFRGGRGGGRGGGGDKGYAGKGGGSGGRGGGYHKDASSNFGQNLDYQQQSQYSGHGHRECYPDHRNTGGYQGGSGGGGNRGGNYRDSNTNYNQNYGQGSGQSYGQGSDQNYGQSYGQNYQSQSQYSGQRDSYRGDNRSGGNYYQDRREGGGGRGGGGGGGGGGRSNRVQGGWNQGGNNSGVNSYQRGGYNKGKGRQY